MCISCVRPAEWGSKCGPCYFGDKAYKNLGKGIGWKLVYEMLRAQNFRCYYTNVPLSSEMMNLALDHKLSRARFPEYASDPENVVWCDRRINNMKSVMTDQEFVQYFHYVALSFFKKHGYKVVKEKELG